MEKTKRCSPLSRLPECIWNCINVIFFVKFAIFLFIFIIKTSPWNLEKGLLEVLKWSQNSFK